MAKAVIITEKTEKGLRVKQADLLDHGKKYPIFGIVGYVYANKNRVIEAVLDRTIEVSDIEIVGT
jgi:hypothetical protein